MGALEATNVSTRKSILIVCLTMLIILFTFIRLYFLGVKRITLTFHCLTICDGKTYHSLSESLRIDKVEAMPALSLRIDKVKAIPALGIFW